MNILPEIPDSAVIVNATLNLRQLQRQGNWKDYNGNVVIYSGTKVSSIGAEMPEVFTKADEQFPSCEIIPVEGADHSFAGGAMNTVIDGTVDFVKNNH